MTVFSEMAQKIITEQALVIGPLAWKEASKVSGIQINREANQVDLVDTNPSQIIDRLVTQYDRLFGLASHEVSREAAIPFLASLSPAEIPMSLK